MSIEKSKFLLVLIFAVGTFSLAVLDKDARLVFVGLANTAVGGYFGASIPGDRGGL